MLPEYHAYRLEQSSDVRAVAFSELVPAVMRGTGQVAVQLMPRLAGVVHSH